MTQKSGMCLWEIVNRRDTTIYRRYDKVEDLSFMRLLNGWEHMLNNEQQDNKKEQIKLT